MKLMWRIGGNLEGVSGMDGQLLAAKSCFQLTFEKDEGLLKIVPVRRRAAAWGDVHVNYAEAPGSLFASYGHGVGVADQTDVRKTVGMGQSEIAVQVVGWDCWCHFIFKVSWLVDFARDFSVNEGHTFYAYREVAKSV